MKKSKRPFGLKKIQRFEFAEMNLKHCGDEAKTLGMVRRAVRMGYDTVVINIDVGDLRTGEDLEGPPKKKKKKGKVDDNGAEQKFHNIPDPFQVDESKLDLSLLDVKGKKFRQFRCPDEMMLSTLSRKGELIDLITLDDCDSGARYPWIHKQKLVQACVEEGITFEISYAQALEDTQRRRQILTNGQHLYRIARRGRGLIISSGAETVLRIRSPYDAANLTVLFGARPCEGKKLVSENCCQLLLRSQSRRTVKGAFHQAELESAPVPPNENVQTHRLALEMIPEFKEQMEIY